eukprot:3582453-Pleurochrysis_carterae.AAC.1
MVKRFVRVELERLVRAARSLVPTLVKHRDARVGARVGACARCDGRVNRTAASSVWSPAAKCV